MWGQINYGYNTDLLELFQLLRKSDCIDWRILIFMIWALGNEKYSELSSTKSSLHLTRTAVCV